MERTKDYEPRNIFNADETALYFKCLPDKTYEFKDEKCHGGKHSKERVTVLLATNMTGTDMIKPLVIGKSKKPRCFAGVKSLPVEYTANKKAWMNAELFASWLTKLDKQMGREKRKIILFIDNCSAHNTIPPLKWVNVQFLPANTTSKLQPLDQGIIKNFKVLYRTEVVRKFLSDIEEGKECAINLLEAIRLINKSWRRVATKTVRNCFKSCGFSFENEPDKDLSDIAEETELPCMDMENEWETVTTNLQADELIFEEFAFVDEGVAVTGTLTDADIVEAISNEEDAALNEEEEEGEINEPAQVTPKEARAAIQTLRIFLEKTGDVPDCAFSSVVSIENIIDKQVAKSVKQKKITNFFL